MHRLIAITLCGLLLSGVEASVRAAPVSEAEETAREYKIKAAFLYNFAKFTEWPEDQFEDPAAPLRVCVLGQDPFGEQLYSIAGKNVRGRQVAISSLSHLEGTDLCHLLFISVSEAMNLKRMVRWLD